MLSLGRCWISICHYGRSIRMSLSYKCIMLQRLYKRRLGEWGEVILLISIGGVIYLLFRPKCLLMFSIIEEMGGMPYLDGIREKAQLYTLPSFVINSLPAGLWTASYLLGMYITTKYQSRKIRLMLALPLPLSAIALELMQLIGWCPGTFDVYDLICYIVPLVVFVKSV